MIKSVGDCCYFNVFSDGFICIARGTIVSLLNNIRHDSKKSYLDVLLFSFVYVSSPIKS